MAELSEAGAPGRPAVLIRGLSKTFGANRALAEVDLRIEPGEVHVLAGANGSGKSTLIKILAAYHVPDPGGEVLIDGQPLAFGAPTSAYRLGCRFVHQDLGLIASNTVLDNLSITAGYATRFGTIRRRAAAAEARAALARVGLEGLPLSTPVSELSAAERTGVAVARAIRHDPDHPVRVVVLDEPTATMPADEVERLLTMIRAIAARGVAVLLVTHHLDEVFEVGDTISVLRDGALIATSRVADIDHDTLVEQLTGDVVEPVRPADATARARSSQVALEVTDLATDGIRGISFAAHRGEVLGIAGLIGSGRERLLGATFGRHRVQSGTVEVGARRLAPGRPDLAIRAGVAYMPGDRKTHGGVMDLSARENMTLPALRSFWRGVRINRRSERAEVRRWFDELGVRPREATAAPLASFSGGNQQKILVGKWIRQKPDVLLIDEPTQGVDIGAKAELHRQLLKLAEAGTSVVVSSSDLEELATVSDRVLIMRGGRVVEELTGHRINATEINRCCLTPSSASPTTDTNEVVHS